MAKPPTRAVAVDEASGCATWQGMYDKEGAGIAFLGGRRVRAARLFFAELHGCLGGGMLRQLCSTLGCVSPHHHTLRSPRSWLEREYDVGGWTIRSAKKLMREEPGSLRWSLDDVPHLYCNRDDLERLTAQGHPYHVLLAAYADLVRDELRRLRWGDKARMHD